MFFFLRQNLSIHREPSKAKTAQNSQILTKTTTCSLLNLQCLKQFYLLQNNQINQQNNINRKVIQKKKKERKTANFVLGIEISE